jgi:hypothetical protein
MIDDKQPFERIKRITLALIELAKITSLTEYASKPNERIYYLKEDGDYYLVFKSTSLLCDYEFKTSLEWLVLAIHSELELLFSNPFLMILVTDKNRDEVLDHLTLHILFEYHLYLQGVLFHRVHRAFKDSLINFIKTKVEPAYKEEMIISQTTTLVPNNNLKFLFQFLPDNKLSLIKEIERMDETLAGIEKDQITGRNSWMFKQDFEEICTKYEELRRKYAVAKRDHKQLKKSYFHINLRASSEDWMRYWENYVLEKYPSLKMTEQIEFNEPSNLAYLHLAKFYTYSVDFIKKKVKESRNLAKEKEAKKRKSRLRKPNKNNN